MRQTRATSHIKTFDLIDVQNMERETSALTSRAQGIVLMTTALHNRDPLTAVPIAQAAADIIEGAGRIAEMLNPERFHSAGVASDQ